MVLGKKKLKRLEELQNKVPLPGGARGGFINMVQAAAFIRLKDNKDIKTNI
jgi:hypothetical protein